MRLLLDTQVVVWTLADPRRLGRLQGVIADATEVTISVLAAWELSIKQANGKIDLPLPAADFVDRAVSELDALLLSVETPHIRALAGLPAHHRDPFDRMLVAQALTEDLKLVSADALMARYLDVLAP